MERLPVVAVVGPTAVGKSGLALALAGEVGGEIVNADAFQVYRGLDIGTAKPTPAEQARVPHHLIDVVDPEETWSAGAFAERARTLLDAIRERGATPIVVGGSGLYLRALLEGISTVPRDLDERRRLNERLETEGLPALYAELGEKDPEGAARLAPGDTQRILRALEVFNATGTPMGEWIRRGKTSPSLGGESAPAVRLGLTLPRDVLYDRISDRVRQMVERGWLEEVRALLETGIDPAAPGFRAIGYRQMVSHLQGELSLAEAVDETVRATRRYAKRQLTWFRKEQGVEWIAAAPAPQSVPLLLRRLATIGRRVSSDQECGGFSCNE